MTQTRVLFLAADPTDAARLRLGKEQREIRTALRLASGRDSIEFTERFAARPADLTQALHDVRPHVVHFSGHGASGGELCFENDEGVTQPVDPEALAALFALVGDDVRAVILNACYSETQALAIGRSVDHVIGMSDAVADDAAIRFATGFYKALGAGRDYRQSFDFGVAEIRLHGMPDHLIPVLHQRRPAGPAHFRSAEAPHRGTHAGFRFRGGPGSEAELPVRVETGRFSSVRELIETLYRHYLSERVPPFTYGSEWIITGAWNDSWLLAPASWVETPGRPVRDADAGWSDHLGLDEAGITPGSDWTVRMRRGSERPLTTAPFAVVSDDPDVRAILRSDPKGFWALSGRLRPGRREEVAGKPPASVVVLENWSEPADAEGHHRWFVDRGGPLPQDARYYLRRAQPGPPPARPNL